MNCENCAGYGIKFVKAGIPNIIDVCPDCNGVGGTTRFVDCAREIATLANRGQYRRGPDGQPSNEAYIHHCKRIADRFENDPAAEALAWLHDTMEDHPDKVDRLKLEVAGIPQRVIEAVEVITKRKGERYGVYLLRVKQNPLACRVKIRDMLDNLGSDPTDQQIVKYSTGILYLLGRIGQSELDNALA